MRASILTVLLGIATLAGCAFPGVYKLNVQQGNIVTDDMLAQLETGMNQRQVEYVMGMIFYLFWDNIFVRRIWVLLVHSQVIMV